MIHMQKLKSHPSQALPEKITLMLSEKFDAETKEKIVQADFILRQSGSAA
jgi:hypothetical protein